jgi:hypothetical protein
MPPVDPLADDDAPNQVRALAEQGLTDSEIALRVGASVEAVRAMPDVRVPLSPVHDARVERALYERAVGGETWAEVSDKLGGTVRLYQRVLPDPSAAAKWLATRKAEAWGDRPMVATNYVVHIPMPAVTSQDWLRMVRDSGRQPAIEVIASSVPVGSADPDGDSGDGTPILSPPLQK